MNSISNLFSMFKKGHTYGEILLFLYKNPEYRYELEAIKERVSEVDITCFTDVMIWLLTDELIVYEKNFPIENDPVFVEVYRISYKGFTFIKDLKEKRNSRIINSITIGVACLSILISSIVSIVNSNKTTKVEITNLSHLKNKTADTAPPINSPCNTPIIINGKSSVVQGNPK
jgi:hypothetical protein